MFGQHEVEYLDVKTPTKITLEEKTDRGKPVSLGVGYEYIYVYQFNLYSVFTRTWQKYIQNELCSKKTYLGRHAILNVNLLYIAFPNLYTTTKPSSESNFRWILYLKYNIHSLWMFHCWTSSKDTKSFSLFSFRDELFSLSSELIIGSAFIVKSMSAYGVLLSAPWMRNSRLLVTESNSISI